MKLDRMVLALSLLLVIAVVALGFWLRSDVREVIKTADAKVPSAIAMTRLPDTQAVPVLPPLQSAERDSPLPEVAPSEVDAVVALNEARLHGDARAPMVVRDAPQPSPSAAELADPEAYQHYEQRQNQRLHKAYVQAADSEIPKLQQDIARARNAGLSEEQIREGEEKLRRIQAMRDQLQTSASAAP